MSRKRSELGFNYSSSSVIVRECGQTLGLGLVDKNRTVVNY